MPGKIAKEKREFGDYQTPFDFAEKVCKTLKGPLRVRPDVILEPTCGIGRFLEAARVVFQCEKYIGIEINPDYVRAAKERFHEDGRVELIHRDLHSLDLGFLKRRTSDSGHTLVIGNPPWVNNSTLSSLSGGNLPAKSNFKGMKGLDAITGSANFDICENMILKMIEVFQGSETTIAMLCKSIVARNVFQELKRRNIPFSSANVFTFDAQKVFGISAESCLFVLRLSAVKGNVDSCGVFDFEKPEVEITRFGYKNEKFYSNLEGTHFDFDGTCCFQWRQGIKHDCAKIMEVEKRNGILFNGNGEVLDIEPDLLYPLVKSSHVKRFVISETKKMVLVTQRKIGENTEALKTKTPLSWEYLNRNKEFFAARKSAIYRNAPDFSMFGIGPYSFAPYKVGVSGFYKKPIFALLRGERPIMMDDTCYFLGFENLGNAYTAMLTLNSPAVREFLKTICFIDSKRPYTKKTLQRIDFGKILATMNFAQMKKIETDLKLERFVTEKMFEGFRTTVKKTGEI